MDLLRSFGLGQYVAVESLVHRLDPRTKILATFVLVIVVFAVHTSLGLAVLSVFLAAVLLGGRIPVGYALRGLRPVFWLVAFAVVFQVFFGDPGGHPIFHRGPVIVTRENLRLGLFYGYRLIPWCMRTGEVAATAAVMAVKQGIPPKDLKWTSGYFNG